MNIPNLPGYVSIREAAEIIGCSDKRVYQYVTTGRLSARRIGHMLVLPLEEVQQFHPGPSGRTRAKAPPWRVYRSGGKLFVTTIQAQIRSGMREKLLERLANIKPETHNFTGNIARYVINKGEMVQIMLIWKNTEIPDETTRQQDLRLFQRTFADVLDWETASYSFDDVLLHT